MAADITGNIPSSFIQALAPVYPPGEYPSHIDVFGKGGFVPLNDALGASSQVDFINERIIEQRRKVGMLVFLSDTKEYYRCSSITGNDNWEKQYFSGRYFHGPTAPTADDIIMGERWFDTVVGTEYTYVPIAEGSTYLAWIDLDHLGQNESGDIYVKKSGDTMNGTLTGNIADFGHITADTGFIGTLTGNIADFGHVTADTGFIGTLTGEKASFRNTQDGRASLEVAIGSTGYTDNFWDFVAGTIVNEEGLTSNVFGVSTTSHSQTPSAGVFNGNLIVGQPGYNEKSRLEVWGSINTTGNNNYSVLSTFRSPTLFRGFTAQNSDYWEGGTNNLTIGNDYDEDLKVSLRAFNDVVVGRAHRNSDRPITFPREFITKEYAENNTLARPSGNNTITFNKEWVVLSESTSDIPLGVLTEESMGFKFPVDISLRWSAGVYERSRGCSKFWTKTYINVNPSGGSVTITVDRDRMVPFDIVDSPPNISTLSSDSSSLEIGGWLEGNPNPQNEHARAWCWIDVFPSL